MTIHQKLMKKEAESGLFDRLSDLIKCHQRFVVTTHLVPDGDGLGGEIALAEYLKELGKECIILNSDSTPDKFALVDPDQDIKIWQGEAFPEVDIIFGVDVNDKDRL